MDNQVIQSEFYKIKKCIKSVKHFGQIEACENLVELFRKKHFEDEMTSIDEISMESEIRTLNELINEVKEKFSEL